MIQYGKYHKILFKNYCTEVKITLISLVLKMEVTNMYINSGYMNNSLIDFKDKSKPLIVGSCGTYRLQKQPKLPTFRPRGRIDYQIIYVVAGKGYFFLNGKDEVVNAGHIVLYRPKEIQKYVYYGTDQTEVYWVHFTGNNVKNLLRSYHFPDKGHVFYIGTSPEYVQLFKQMIQELQMCKPHYENLLSMLLHQLLILISRQFAENAAQKKMKMNTFLQNEMIRATQYFSEHYNTEIRIDQYAASRHMSTSLFIRAFKQYNHLTPMQYILALRMSSAQNLLETTSYNVSRDNQMEKTQCAF